MSSGFSVGYGVVYLVNQPKVLGPLFIGLGVAFSGVATWLAWPGIKTRQQYGRQKLRQAFLAFWQGVLAEGIFVLGTLTVATGTSSLISRPKVADAAVIGMGVALMWIGAAWEKVSSAIFVCCKIFYSLSRGTMEHVFRSRTGAPRG